MIKIHLLADKFNTYTLVFFICLSFSLTTSSAFAANLSGNSTAGTISINSDKSSDTAYGYLRLNPVYADGGKVIVNQNGIISRAIGGRSFNTKSINNQVIINGGEVTGDIIGGFSFSGTAKDNQVIINSGKFSSSSIFYGWQTNNTGTSGGNNSLHIKNKEISIKNIKNFERLYFYLPNNIAANNVLLILNDSADTNIQNTDIGVAVQSGKPLAKGEQITLIKRTNATGSLLTDSNLNNNTTGMQGISLDYKFKLKKSNNDLIATVEDIKVAPKTQTITTTNSGLASSIIGAGSLLANAGIAAALNATNFNSVINTKNSWILFSTLDVGKTEYDYKVQLKTQSLSIATGIARHFDSHYLHTVLGLFYEQGKNTFNTEQTIDSVIYRGQGDSHYAGGGILLHSNILNSAWGFESSLSLGKLQSHYQNKDMRLSNGQYPNYENHDDYINVHLGVDYKLPLAHFLEAQLALKVLYSKISGDELSIASDKFKIEPIHSLRARPSLRINYLVNTQLTLHTGLAFVREFSAKSTGSVYDQELPETSLIGNNRLLEAGLQVQPLSRLPLLLNLDIQGLRDFRQGVNASLSVQYRF